MSTIEQLALAVLEGEQLTARALAQEILSEGSLSSLIEPNAALDDRIAIMAAALAELLASYEGVEAPTWTSRWGAMPSMVDLLPATGERLRNLLTEQAPEALRRRNILAPRGFLRAV